MVTTAVFDWLLAAPEPSFAVYEKRHDADETGRRRVAERCRPIECHVPLGTFAASVAASDCKSTSTSFDSTPVAAGIFSVVPVSTA